MDAFKSVGVAGDAATLTTLGVTAVGGAVASPVLIAAGVAIAGLAGWSVYRDWKTGEKIDKVPAIEDALAHHARTKRIEKAALEDVLISICDDPAAMASLPDGVGHEPLAALLAIIRAEGKEREALLAAQPMLVENLHGWMAREFGAIRESLDLQDETLDEAVEALRSVRADIETFQWLWMNQRRPVLHIPRADDTNESERFKFAARRVTMQGREAELAELEGFLDDPGPFRWWAWIANAGMGKSRLALELCMSRDKAGWDAGFYDWERAEAQPTGWDTWSPAKPTLIVFDYVYEHAEAIRDAIISLSRYSRSLIRPVRVLVLERPPPGMERVGGKQSGGLVSLSGSSWWDTILDRGHGTNSGHVSSAAFKGPEEIEPVPRRLGGLESDAVGSIFTELSDKAGARLTGEEIAGRVAQLERVDPERRPLYVALAAEAIESGAMQPRWNAQDLVSYVLNREIERWKGALRGAGVADGPGGELPRWLGLYRLSTMCGGLRLRTGEGSDQPADVLKDATLEDDLPSRREYGDGSTLALIAPGATADEAPRLEPDMLGELFVLEGLARAGGSAGRHIDAAWRYDAAGYGDFLVRAANSFPTHETLNRLLGVPAEETPGDEADAWALVFALAVRADRLLDLGDVEIFSATTAAFVASLRAVRAADPGNVHATVWLALGLVNAIAHSGADTGRADGLLQELRGLRGAHPDDAAVREQLATGLFNAFNNSGADTGRADGLLTELRGLRADHPDDPAVRENLAKGLVNAFNNSGADTGRADGLLTELQGLRADHPDDPAVREQLAKGLSNAIAYCGADTGRADGLLQELRGLRGAHPDDAAVREQLATGLFNAFNNSGADTGRADGLLTELRGLRADHPDDPAVREILASGLFNAFRNSGADTGRADGLLTELRGLRADHPGDAAVRERLASGLFNAFNNSGADTGRADGLLTELRGLRAAHPDDAAVRENLAMGLFNAFNNSRADTGRADGLLTELRGLRAAHPDDAAVREELAKGLVVQMFRANEAGRPGLTADALDEMVPLKESLLTQPKAADFCRAALSKALDLATEQDDADSGRRLVAASRLIFGD